jgi:acylpyruvate hydrolase
MRLVTVATPEGATAAAVESEGGLLALLDGPGWSSAAERTEPLDGDVRVIRPVLSPAATVCVGINYGTHVREMGRDLPTSPTLFSKLSQALTDPGASVVIPAGSTQVDYEGELVAVVGTGGREIAAEDAFDHVAGLTLMNDVTMRDFQYRSLQWFAGKSWRASTPVGPVLVTLDELPDLGERELTTTVNGELRQSGTIGDLIFDIPALVADISQFIELQPGDLIATGTPGGVGHAMDPPSYLEPGDVVEVSLDGLGTLATTFTGPP